jgi:HEAT repeat protein
MEEESKRIFGLIHALNQSDKKALRQAVDALIATAPGLPRLAPELERRLADKPGADSWPLAYVLAHLSSPSSLCLKVLGETLGIADPDIRWAVAVLLIRQARQEPGIVKLLFDLVKSGLPTQRRMALYCLRDIAPDDRALLRTLLESLDDADPLVRVAAASSLKNRADLEPNGVNRLLDLFLRDPDARARRTAALVLGQLGAPTAEVRAALADASASPDPQLKKAALAALALLTKKGPST